MQQVDPSPVDPTVDQDPHTAQLPAEDVPVDLPADAPHMTQLPAEDEPVDLPSDASSVFVFSLSTDLGSSAGIADGASVFTASAGAGSAGAGLSLAAFSVAVSSDEAT